MLECSYALFSSDTNRPPGARTLQAHLQAGAAAVNSPNFSLAYDNSSRPGRITQQSGKPMPPGAEFVSKAASKNAKKRANKKAKAADGEGDDGNDEQVEQGAAGASSSGNAGAVAAATEHVSGLSVGDGADAAQKRIRALQKKLRQIQQLKERRDKEGKPLVVRADRQRYCSLRPLL